MVVDYNTTSKVVTYRLAYGPSHGPACKTGIVVLKLSEDAGAMGGDTIALLTTISYGTYDKYVDTTNNVLNLRCFYKSYAQATCTLLHLDTLLFQMLTHAQAKQSR